jgi:hypothetical protein
MCRPGSHRTDKSAYGNQFQVTPQKGTRIRGKTHIIVFRLTDQMAWSGGFFLFNMAAAFTFAVSSYAAVTVAASIGVIGAACVRAYALDGLLVAGAKAHVGLNESFSGRIVWVSSVVGGAVAGALSLLWIWLSTHEAPSWSLIVLSMTVVLADAPHYLLIMKRAYSRALRAGMLYLLGGAIAILFAKQFGPMAVMLTWVMSTLACTLAGWLSTGKSATLRLEFAYRHISRRMGAEALYSALGSQLGIFLIYLTSDASVTTGIRLAYLLVFAPAFMLIQGLTPIYLVRMSDLYRRASNKGTRLASYWIIGSCILLGVAGACGFFAASLPLFDKTNLSATIPYLIPVGLSIMGGISFDAALLGWRFRVSPKFPHRARLATVGVDLATQVTGVLVAGPQGLVVALICTALLKATLAMFMILKLRHKPVHSSSPVDSATREESGVVKGI